MEETLSERQRAVLRLLVEQYVSGARPVASDVLAARSDLGVSPATVRNTMAELERAGYIMQPHTSAGRIPSDKGYRYFVEHLMPRPSLPQDEQRTIQHQFFQVQLDVEEWSHLAASVLSRLAHNAAVATAPRSVAPRLKHIQLLELGEGRIMLVLVARDGSVAQQIITLEETWNQEQLSALAANLDARLRDQTATQIVAASATLPAEMPALARRVAAVAGAMLSRMEAPVPSDFYREGLAQLLEQPEFRETDRLKQMLEMLEGGAVLLSILPAVRASEGVQVIIGDEHGHDQMRNVSVVVARYGLADQISGLLAVIGPTRMPYSRAVGGVGYVSDLLTSMIGQVYGVADPPQTRD